MPRMILSLAPAPALLSRSVGWPTSDPVGRLEPVEDGRSRRAPLIPEGIAVCLTLVGENGEPADYPVADQAAQPVVAGHLRRPGQQAGCGGAGPRSSQSTARAARSRARQRELIPVHHP